MHVIGVLVTFSVTAPMQLMTNPDAAVAAGPPRFAKVGFALPHSSRTHRESKQFNVPLGGGVLDLSCAFANFARDDRKMLGDLLVDYLVLALTI